MDDRPARETSRAWGGGSGRSFDMSASISTITGAWCTLERVDFARTDKLQCW